MKDPVAPWDTDGECKEGEREREGGGGCYDIV